jgi:hypothetical protein
MTVENESAYQAGVGAGNAVGEDGNKSQHNYRTSPAFRESLPCTCHERSPCRVCIAWHEHYVYTRAAVKAFKEIAGHE